MPKGFFEKSLLVSKAPPSLVPKCGACGLYKTCKSPKMPYSGKGKKSILIIGEAPGAYEDEQGKHFVGKTGKHFEAALRKVGIDMRRDCWLYNSIICRPEDGDTPTEEQVDYCRPNVISVINELKPEKILLAGHSAVKSVIGWLWKNDVGKLEKWLGWNVPCQRLNAWLAPVWPPAAMITGVAANNEVMERLWLEHLERFALLQGRPWDEVPDWTSKVKRELDDKKAAGAIRCFIAFGNPVAIDYETNMLKPDSKRREIVCCAVSDGETAVAFPWRGMAREETQILIKSKVPKIASNMKFEERWTIAEFGHGMTNWLHDTMLAAHALDNREGVTGLKFQSFVELGFGNYNDHLEGLLDSKGSNEPNQVKTEIDLDQLLLYCGLDALLEVKLAQKQMKRLGISR